MITERYDKFESWFAQETRNVFVRFNVTDSVHGECLITHSYPTVGSPFFGQPGMCFTRIVSSDEQIVIQSDFSLTANEVVALVDGFLNYEFVGLRGECWTLRASPYAGSTIIQNYLMVLDA